MTNILKTVIVLFTIVLHGTFMQAQEKTSVLMNNAMEQAQKENKHIFIKYGASWCGWCKKMDKQMKSDQLAAYFQDNYVIVNLVVSESEANKKLENPGALELLTKLKGEKSGLPFWVIMNAKGEVVTDSFDKKNQNLGCPATKEEVSQFLGKLKITSTLTQKDLNVIEEVFVD